MRCSRKGCNGLAHLEEEFTKRGSVYAYACPTCGWRGPIIRDDRIRVNSQEALNDIDSKLLNAENGGAAVRNGVESLAERRRRMAEKGQK